MQPKQHAQCPLSLCGAPALGRIQSQGGGAVGDGWGGGGGGREWVSGDACDDL